VGVVAPVLVRREQEGVAALDVAALLGVHLLVGAALALVFDDPLALGDRAQGEHAVAVDVGLSGGDLAGHSAFLWDDDGSKPGIVARSGVKWPCAGTQKQTILVCYRERNGPPGCQRAPRHPPHRL